MRVICDLASVMLSGGCGHPKTSAGGSEGRFRWVSGVEAGEAPSLRHQEDGDLFSYPWPPPAHRLCREKRHRWHQQPAVLGPPRYDEGLAPLSFLLPGDRASSAETEKELGEEALNWQEMTLDHELAEKLLDLAVTLAGQREVLPLQNKMVAPNLRNAP